MADKVTFDGENKVIIIKSGVTDIDVQIDLYSDWKEWASTSDNSKYWQAFRTFGGDPTSASQFAPRYFFLINNWRIVAEDVSVSMQTNLYSDDYAAPFDITNAAILLRNSDASVVKSELEERLNYGDRIYYDETSIYDGVSYPVGTIAEPVNNITDAVALGNLYNIRDFYCLSDVFMQGITGVSFGNYSIFADRENLRVYSTGNTFYNMDWHGFTMDVDFGGGGGNLIDKCIVESVTNISGQMTSCQIGTSNVRGTVRVEDDLVMSYCYSGVAGAGTPLYDMHPGKGVKLSIRAYSGGVEIVYADHTGDTATVELIAGQIRLDSSCTEGYLDLRGVGYITDNSSGSTINTIGFVDSFQQYVEETREIDEQLAYQNKLYLDQASGFTGTTYPVGTQAKPVNNIINLFQLSQELNIKNIHVITELTLNNMPFVADNFNAFSDIPNVPVYVDSISGSRLRNVGLYGFDLIDVDLAGNEHHFEKCVLRNVKNLAGHLVYCDLDRGLDPLDPFYLSGGTHIEIFGNTTFMNCHPKHAGDPPSIRLVNPSGATCAFRSWNGDLFLDSVTHVADRVIVEMDAGALTIGSGCTNGIIEVRGVGQVIDNSLDTCVVRRDGQLQASPGEYNDEIVIDVTNGKPGTLYPIGTNSYPVDNLTDALTLLSNYQLKRIRVIGTLTISGGEDLSGIAFTAERSVGNVLVITDAITDYTYFTDLTLLVQQSGSCRYTTGVLVDIDDFDGGAKDCLLVGDINIVGDGSNYFTNCDTYTTDVNAPVSIDIGDKKLNIIRCRGFYKLTNKTSTNDVTVDMVGGKLTIDSTCVDGKIYIAGICEVIDNSASGCTVIRDAQLQSSPFEYGGEIVIDTVNGSPGTLFPVGTNSKPVDNFADALVLLDTYDLDKLHIEGALSLDGENLSYITFSADRSVGNYLSITNSVTDNVYIENLTCLNIVQSGTCRYTTSVLVNVDNYDGGAKDCLLVGDFNIVGNGSNYFTNCDRYVTDPSIYSVIDVGDKNLNIIRGRGNYKIINKTSTNTTTIDLVAGLVEVDSSCVSGSIFIGGISEIIDNSGSGCTVNLKALSNSSIADATWDEQLSQHLLVGSTGDALNNVSAGASPELIAAAVWNAELSSYLNTGSTGEALSNSSGSTVLIAEISEDTKRILGLVQENFRVFDQVYDAEDKLQSATVRIYPTPTDTDNNTNPLAEYGVTALYDGSGRLVDYKSVKI